LKLRYTRRALLDPTEIYDFIAADNPVAYRDIQGEVQILSVLHSARSWPDDL
jgi:plasmid stabilization system protein ParE